MKKYIMALDAGTTSNRCILFDHDGKMVSVSQKEFTQYFPEAGWVEHDAEEIMDTFMTVIKSAMDMAGATAKDIAAIGITNQRETTVIWDKETGKPVYHAIVWQCRRTADYCDRLVDEGLGEWFRNKTGLIVDPYFSATKIRWILENVEGVRERSERGELLFGTIETWIIWKLTGHKVHVTDYSNASRTMMFNIHTLEWDKEILDKLDIPESILPEVKPSSCIYGMTDPDLLGGEIPISGAAGDQQCALFGQNCFDAGEVKNTYGTGCFMLLNTGNTPVESRNGLVTTIAWGLNGEVKYALEGSVFVCGAAIQWLRDEMKFLESAGDSQKMALEVEDTLGVYMVPAFAGLGAPYWKPHARGGIFGLTRGTTINHIVRATLDSQAYQTYDVLMAMEADSGIKITSLKVDGGAACNNYMLQFQSDILDIEVVRPACVETTAMGAAFLAGLAVGYYRDLDEIRRIYAVDRTFKAQMDRARAAEMVAGWQEAVKRVM